MRDAWLPSSKLKAVLLPPSATAAAPAVGGAADVAAGGQAGQAAAVRPVAYRLSTACPGYFAQHGAVRLGVGAVAAIHCGRVLSRSQLSAVLH